MQLNNWLQSLKQWTSQAATIVCFLAILFALAPPAVFAAEGKPCNAEPMDTTILYGEIVTGPNCAINTPADTDRLRFQGSAGETIIANLVDTDNTAEACLDLFSPSNVFLLQTCARVPNGVHGMGPVTLTETGTYTLVVSEENANKTVGYSVCLERLKEPSPASNPLTLGQRVTGEVNPAPDFDLYHFTASEGDVLRLDFVATGITNTQAFTLVAPDGAFILQTGPGIRNIALTQTGTYVAVLWSTTTLQVVTYDVLLRCLLGTCTGVPHPTCTTELNPSYSEGLNLAFLLGNQLAGATWNVWLSFGSSTTRIVSAPLPATPIHPPMPISIPIPTFPSLGTIGVLTTVTTAANGIACSDWEVVDTGTPAAKMPTQEELEALIRSHYSGFPGVPDQPR